MIHKDCAIECERIVQCSICGRDKAPRGRDLSAAAAGSLCQSECVGYWKDPRPGHLWPGELARERHGEATA